MNFNVLARFLLLLPALMLTLQVSAASPDPDDLNAAIDEIFSWTSREAPGCTVAVAKDGQLVANRAYGSADLERDVLLRPESILDAGSLTKQFVAASVLLLVEEQRLSLSDDVRKHIPELPVYGHLITLDHLLTHTSGVRDWTGMMPLVEGDIDALALTLRQEDLNFAPGEEWAYSNGGYVLLKEIVARTSGMTFGEFTQKHLFDPLGMKSTSYRDDLRRVIPNRALAYDKEEDGWRMAVLFDNERGGGGALLSTAHDLVIWNEALASERLGKFVTAALHEPAKLNNGRELGYARGLFLDANQGGQVVWHTGSADGYKSALSRYPEQRLSIAIMCNSGDGTNRLAFARQIYDLLVPSSAPAQSAEAHVERAEAVVIDADSRAGLFVSNGLTEPLRLVAQDGRLRIAGAPPLVAETGDRFRSSESALSFMSEAELELHFLSDDELDLRTAEGDTTRYTRAEPWEPAQSDLAKFAGRYESREIGTTFLITAADGALQARLEHAPDRFLPLRPLYRDVFQLSRMLFRFIRDDEGNVTGLAYSNPMLRDAMFTPSPAHGEPVCPDEREHLDL